MSGTGTGAAAGTDLPPLSATATKSTSKPKPARDLNHPTDNAKSYADATSATAMTSPLPAATSASAFYAAITSPSPLPNHSSSSSSSSSSSLPACLTHVSSGAWIPFRDDVGRHLHLRGAGGGGGVGLPNFVPLGHPALFEAQLQMQMQMQRDTRERREEWKEMETRRMILREVGEMDGGSSTWGGTGSSNGVNFKSSSTAFSSKSNPMVEGSSYVSPAERRRIQLAAAKQANSDMPTAAAGATANGTSTSASGTAASRSIVSPSSSSPRSNSTSLPTFDVTKFMRNQQRNMANLESVNAIDILKTEPFARTSSDLRALSHFLSSGVEFFSSLPPDTLLDVARLARLRYVKKDEVVYSQGEKARHMYVVLSGCIGTKIKDGAGVGGRRASSSMDSSVGFVAATSMVGESFGQENMNVNMHMRSNMHSSGSNDGEDQSNGSMQDLHDPAATVATATTQPPIGPSSPPSLAAPQGSQYRASTKVALDHSDLLQLDLHDLSSILRASMSRDLEAKIDFIASMSLFDSASTQQLQGIAPTLRRKTFEKNDLILTQGCPSDRVYFIVEGFVRIVAKLNIKEKIHTPQHLLPLQHHAQMYERGRSAPARFSRDSTHAGSRKKTTKNAPGHMGSDEEKYSNSHGLSLDLSAALRNTSSRRPPPPALIANRSVLLDLGRLGPRSFFGELGVLNETGRSASVYAETKVVTFCMEKEEFQSKLPTSCRQFLTQYAQSFYPSPKDMIKQYQHHQRWQAFKTSMLATHGYAAAGRKLGNRSTNVAQGRK